MQLHIGFIGLGLIGGSIAKALRRYYPDAVLTAYTRTAERAAEAVREGILNDVLTDRDPRFSECDYIFLCAPVETNITYLPFLKEVIKPSCTVTDVGSVKGCMAKAAERCGLQKQFIGGHPMAGSEKTGYASSSDVLLENAYYIITPGPDSDPRRVQSYAGLVQSLKAIPIILSPGDHDNNVAAISHLPHIIAASLVNTVASLDHSSILKRLAAGGFKDITRIASSSPEMWQQIATSNRSSILEVLDRYIDELSSARALVDHGAPEALSGFFSSARNYRDSLPESQGRTDSSENLLYCDIYDEVGGIAVITTLLAVHQINLQNVGVVHNREYEEGVLRLEFYQRSVRDRAAELLLEKGYHIYRRD